jgi:hypothetical protein
MNRLHEVPPGQAGEWERKAQRILATGELPHFAPDADMLALQRRRVTAHISTWGSNGTALILGATPELADLALGEGLRVVSVDRSAGMFAAAARRRGLSDPARETWIVGDWLDMGAIARGSMDVVLGDASLNNVPHRQIPALLDEIARITRTGSLISLRQIVLPDAAVAEYEFAEALAALRAGSISLHDFDRIVRFYSFHSAAFDPGRHLLDACRVFEAIREKRNSGELNGDEFDFLMKRYSEIKHTVYRLSEQQRQLDRLGACEVDLLPASCRFRRLMAHFAVTVR